MSDDIPIGPNACDYCGEGYGEHTSWCQKNVSYLHARIKELQAEVSRLQSIADHNAAQCMALEAERDRLRKSIKQYLDCQTTNQWVTHFLKALKGG